MKWESIFLLTAFFIPQGFSLQIEDSGIEERLVFLEVKHGHAFDHRPVRSVVKAEFLYWKADVDAVAYATTSRVVNVSGGGSARDDVKTRTPHFSYDPGFRLALEVESPYDLFNIGLTWTRIFSKGTDHAHTASVNREIVDEIGLVQPLISNPSKGSADCHIRGNLLDLEFARGIEMSKHFFLRPYFGARAMWGRVHWDISMKRTFVVPLGANQDSTNVKIDNDFRGVGGLVGLGLDWDLPMGLGLSSKATGALVYGPSKEKTKQDYDFLSANATASQNFQYRAKNGSHTVKGLWGFFFGVFWEKKFARKKHEHITLHQRAQVRVQVGYEFQQWPYSAQKTNTQSSRERDRYSIGFQGFTGGLDIAF